MSSDPRQSDFLGSYRIVITDQYGDGVGDPINTDDWDQALTIDEIGELVAEAIRGHES